MKRYEDLSAPRTERRLDVQYDREAFGRFAESIAHYLGTARFLVWQTVIIVVWIGFNLVAPHRFQFDPWNRGLVLLTLVLSLQASYAAPLILLAQNRQEARDRNQSQHDRAVAERTRADTEFLAREIAGVRLLLADAVTGDELRDQLAELAAALERLNHRVEELAAQVGDDETPETSTPDASTRDTATSDTASDGDAAALDDR